MKKVILTLAIFLPVVSFAKNIDSSLAAQGKITITSKGAGKPIEALAAAKIAYQLLAQKNDLVKNEIQRAQEHSQVGFELSMCGHLDPVKFVVVNSWEAGSPSFNGEMGGDATILVMQPVSCDGVGTGLYGGVAENAIFSLHIDNSITNVFDDNKSKQVLTVTLEGIASIAVKK